MESSRDDFIIAIRSAFLKKGTQQRFSLIGLIFFSIIFLVLGSLNFKVIDYVKIIIKDITYRSSFIVSAPENLVENTYKKILSHFSHYDKYQKISNEFDILKSKDINNRIINLENIKYKKLLDDYFVKDSETFAKVLLDNQSPFLRSVLINKGSKNNIKLGMIVLDEGYLIGKIVEVNYLTSRVLLISDINSKIPVSLEPGGIQAIMSGKNKSQGSLQYIKGDNLDKKLGVFKVITSGSGGVFISGIPIGKIKNNEKNISSSIIKVVHFYKDFSQLKYVKVVSFSKEKETLDQLSKKDSKKVEEEIEKVNRQQEVLRILIEQKKIADEIRVKIEEENTFLKNKTIEIEKKMVELRIIIKENTIKNVNKEFLELNLLYGRKCKKTLFNNLYKVGTQKYKDCVFNKGAKD